MHAHSGDGVVGPAVKIQREQAEWQSEQPHQPAGPTMRVVFHLHAHEKRVLGIFGDLLGEIDDPRGAKPFHWRYLIDTNRPVAKQSNQGRP
ncbi:hypothetical protein [Ancylobacter dichloromethanicus]|uniref:hypothetical protein n=1 Tax=Ancylobacter dichloromethanicus TaxID=518825 RepID=UPI00361615B5